MLFSYKWLQQYIDKDLPKPEDISKKLTMSSFEVESVTGKNGDYIFDVDVLPNRSHDCFCHLGLAKEIALNFDLKIKYESPDLKIPESNDLSIEIADPKLCRRYVGVVIKNVKIEESPLWLKEFLNSIGQKSINNIVDVTNFVMFSLGQPMHAFDMSKLGGYDSGSAKIVIDVLGKDEEFTALLGEKYQLSSEVLAIKDGTNNKTLAIAGIKGGVDAEIDQKTKDIVLESANFDPSLIRRTSQKLKLVTDASKRFENEISSELAMNGMKEAVKLITEIAGGNVEGIVDIYPTRVRDFKIGTSSEKIGKILGVDFDSKIAKNVLDKLGFKYEIIKKPREKFVELGKEYIGKPYKLGASVLREAPDVFDCSSFVCWLSMQVGYVVPRVSIDQYAFGEKIDEKDLRPGDLIFGNSGDGKCWKKTFEYMKGKFNFPEGIDHVGIYIGDNKVIHSSKNNKLGVEITDIKSHPSFKEVVGYSRIIKDEERFVVIVPYDRLDLRLEEDLIEEIGRIYGYEHIKERMPVKINSNKIEKNYYYQEKIREILIDLGFSEVYTYAFQNEGEVELENPLAQDKKYLRVSLRKGLSEARAYNGGQLPSLGIFGSNNSDAYKKLNIFEIGKVFEKNKETLKLGIIGGQIECAVNKINEIFGSDLKILDDFIEIDLDELLSNLPEPDEALGKIESVNMKFKPFSQYPFVLRDIAVWVPESEDKESLKKILINNSDGLLVQDPKLFDEYKKAGKVSYAYKLVFQSLEKTLSDDEVNKVMERINVEIKNKGWEVR